MMSSLPKDAEKALAPPPYTDEPATELEVPPVRRKKELNPVRLAISIILAVLFLSYMGRSHSRQPKIAEVEMPNADELSRLLGLPPHAAAYLQMATSKKPRVTPKQAEPLFLTVPTNDSAHARSVLLATTPHMAGDEGDLITALHVLSHFQSKFGIVPPADPPIYDAGSPESQAATLGASKFGGGVSTWIDKYYPVMNTAVSHSVSVLDSNGTLLWSAPLEEIDYSLPGPDNEGTDPGGIFADTIPAWHGLSKGGEATGHLVKAGYGSPEDFAAAREAGADTNGCVALVAYGGLFRGLKVKAAQEAGCVATLIYSDPVDDGPVTSPSYAPYPSGPARLPTSIQRGSVQYLSVYPGDPTTPNIPAYPNATRLDGGNIPGIPSLPLSMANAAKLLELVKENEGAVVKVVNEVDDRVIPIWNVMAVIPGHIADEVVVLGNHRDAWVMGAADPTSGSATVHEIVEGFSTLLKEGWKPLRTIMFASWDAEEYGLIGSTEWGEDFQSWIEAHVVAYLNVDVSTAGSRLHLGGSPSLAHLLRGAAEAVPHPTDHERTLWDARTDSGPFTGDGEFRISDVEAHKFRDERLSWVDAEEETRLSIMGGEMSGAEYTGVTALGSGSDYTVFLQHIGVASSDGGFAGTASDGVYHYHSVYDSVHWMETYGDPGYHRHAAVAKYLGLATLRIADAIVLPLNTTQYAYELVYYLQKVEDIAATFNGTTPNLSSLKDAILSLQLASVTLDMEKAAAEKDLRKELKKIMHRRCASRPFRAVRDWIKSIFGVKKPKHPRVPRKLIKAAKRVRAVNKQLASFERNFISPEGLKDREWYRNVLVAPGLWLGYGATTFPGLTEALTIEGNSTLAELEAERLTTLIGGAADALKVKALGCGRSRRMH